MKLNKSKINFKNLFDKLLYGKLESLTYSDYARMLEASQVGFLFSLLRLFNANSFSELARALGVKAPQLSAWNCGKTKISKKSTQGLLEIIKKQIKTIKSKDAGGEFVGGFDDYEASPTLLNRLYKFHPELIYELINNDENINEIERKNEEFAAQEFSRKTLVDRSLAAENSGKSLNAFSFKMADGAYINIPQGKLEAFRLVEKSLSAASAVVVYEASRQIADAGKYVFCIDGRLRVVREVLIGSDGQIFYEEGGVLHPLAASMRALISGKVVAIIYE